MNRCSLLVLFVALVAIGCSNRTSQKSDEQDSYLPAAEGMKSPADFAHIDDEEARSRAIFGEIGEVLLHPRCMNCHPAGDRPMQGDASRPHQPLVMRGPDNRGEAGMHCSTCHGVQNFRNVPGSPNWHLAPIEMAWEGKSLAEICRQIKDPERNGGKSLAELVDHMAKDPLVAYGWNPPEQMEPVPGSQELFGQLTQAWVDTGAACPTPASP